MKTSYDFKNKLIEDYPSKYNPDSHRQNEDEFTNGNKFTFKIKKITIPLGKEYGNQL